MWPAMLPRTLWKILHGVGKTSVCVCVMMVEHRSTTLRQRNLGNHGVLFWVHKNQFGKMNTTSRILQDAHFFVIYIEYCTQLNQFFVIKHTVVYTRWQWHG